MKTLRPRLAPTPRHGWQGDTARGNRHERGYGREWEQLREQILERDHGLCQPCLKLNHTTAGNQVDHIVQKSEGGTDHPSNLQTICGPCHRAKTSSESGGRGKSLEAS